MLNRYFIINPHSQVGGVTTSLHIAQAAGVSFNPGSWLRPVSIEIPEKQQEAEIVRELLNTAGLEFHESPTDTASC